MYRRKYVDCVLTTTQNIEGNKTITTLIWVTARKSLGTTDIDKTATMLRFRNR